MLATSPYFTIMPRDVLNEVSIIYPEEPPGEGFISISLNHAEDTPRSPGAAKLTKSEFVDPITGNQNNQSKGYAMERRSKSSDLRTSRIYLERSLSPLAMLVRWSEPAH